MEVSALREKISESLTNKKGNLRQERLPAEEENAISLHCATGSHCSRNFLNRVPADETAFNEL